MVLLTIDQAAERLGTSPRYIRRLLDEDKIRRYKLGKHVRIADIHLDAYIAACLIEPKSEWPSEARAPGVLPSGPTAGTSA